MNVSTSSSCSSVRGSPWQSGPFSQWASSPPAAFATPASLSCSSVCSTLARCRMLQQHDRRHDVQVGRCEEQTLRMVKYITKHSNQANTPPSHHSHSLSLSLTISLTHLSTLMDRPCSRATRALRTCVFVGWLVTINVMSHNSHICELVSTDVTPGFRHQVHMNPNPHKRMYGPVWKSGQCDRQCFQTHIASP